MQFTSLYLRTAQQLSLCFFNELLWLRPGDVVGGWLQWVGLLSQPVKDTGSVEHRLSRRLIDEEIQIWQRPARTSQWFQWRLLFRTRRLRHRGMRLSICLGLRFLRWNQVKQGVHDLIRRLDIRHWLSSVLLGIKRFSIHLVKWNDFPQPRVHNHLMRLQRCLVLLTSTQIIRTLEFGRYDWFGGVVGVGLGIGHRSRYF